MSSQRRRLGGIWWFVLIGILGGTAPGAVSPPDVNPGWHSGRVWSVLFAEGGRELITASDDGTVRFWDLANGAALAKETLRLPGSGTQSLYTAALSPDGRWLALGGNLRGEVNGHSRSLIYLLPRGGNTEPVQVLGEHAGDVRMLAFSPAAGEWVLASGDYNGDCIVWDLKRSTRKTSSNSVSVAGCKLRDLERDGVRHLPGHLGRVAAIAFSAKGDQLVTGSHGLGVRSWGLGPPDDRLKDLGSTMRILAQGEPLALAASPDGRWVAMAGRFAEISGGPETNQLIVSRLDNVGDRRVYPMQSIPQGVAFAADSRSCFVVGGNGLAKRVVLSDPEVAFNVEMDPEAAIRSLEDSPETFLLTTAVSPDGTWIAAAGVDGTVVILWDARTGQVHRRLGAAGRGFTTVAWSPDGHRLAAGPDLTVFDLFDLTPAEDKGKGYVAHVLEREGTVLNTKGADYWTAVRGSAPPVSLHCVNAVSAGTLLDENRAVLGQYHSGDLFTVRLDNGDGMSKFRGHSGWVRDVAAAPGGRFFASVAADGTARVWDGRSGEDNGSYNFAYVSQEPVVSIFREGPDWVAWLPNGRHAGTLGGRRRLGRWVEHGGLVRFESGHPSNIEDQVGVREAVRFRLDATETVERYVARAVARDLKGLPPEQRPSARYVTLAYDWKVGKAERSDLDATRNAASLLFNCLSWGRDVVKPVAVDAAETVYRVLLSNYRGPHEPWGPQWWSRLTAADPYRSLAPPTGCEPAEAEARGLAGTTRPWTRIDWFVEAATKPGLYHELTGLPRNERALYRMLGVRPREALEKDTEGTAARVTVLDSNLSRFPRVLERYPIRQAEPREGDDSERAVWKSYDFNGADDPEDPLIHPLGPEEPDGFAAHGGEIIFHLPNGLPGYFIVDSHGDRWDEVKTSSVVNHFRAGHPQMDPVVRNGLSCFNCHSEGLKVAPDAIRQATLREPTARTLAVALRLVNLHRSEADLKELFEADNTRIGEASQRCRVTPGSGQIYFGVINSVVNKYLKPLDRCRMADELGLSDAEFSVRLKALPPALRDAIGPLSGSSELKSNAWSRSDAISRERFVALLPRLAKAWNLYDPGGMPGKSANGSAWSTTGPVRPVVVSTPAAPAHPKPAAEDPLPSTNDVPALVARARQAAAYERFDRAAVFAAFALSRDPAHPEARLARAMALAREGETQLARVENDALINSPPPGPAGLAARAWAYNERGGQDNFRLAAADCRAALALDPTSVAARVELVYALRGLRQYSEARAQRRLLLNGGVLANGEEPYPYRALGIF